MPERQGATRRTALKWIAAGAAVPAGLPAVHAADFPKRQVKIVNSSSPGGTVDSVARIIADKMTRHLGETVVVEHRPGGSGSIGATHVINGPKDGHLMYIGTSSTLGFIKLLKPDHPYDPVNDFTPVAMVGSVPVGIFAAPSSGFKTIQDLVAAAKAKPGGLSYGSTGLQSVTHLAGELLCQRTGIEMVHVPYTGSGARYWTDLLGGQLHTTLAGVTGGLGMVKDGKLKLLAIASRERSKLLPDVPAMGEVYPGFDVPAWFGLAVAAGTPPDIVKALEAASLAALRDPSTRTQFAKLGVDIDPILSAKAFGDKVVTDNQMWAKTFKAAGLMK